MWVYSCQETLALRNILPIQRNFSSEIMIIHNHPQSSAIIRKKTLPCGFTGAMSFSDSELAVAPALDVDVAHVARPRSAPCRALPMLDLDAMTAEAVELFRKGQQQAG